MTKNNSSEFRKMVESAKEHAEANPEHFEMGMRVISELLFMRYKSLMEAGFSDEQALNIIMARGAE